jgi:hypothetical protein
MLPARLILISAITGSLLPAIGCTMPDPVEPETGTFEWATYENNTVGFSLEYPGVYVAETQEDGNAVLFRAERGVPVKVYWTTEAEAEGNGLWFGKTPIGEVTLAGVAGQLYEYAHCDGPLCSTMKSYVVPWRGRFLALEFRSSGPLHEVNRHVLSSFHIRAPALN